MKEEKSALSLATIRKNRGISLREIADATKISMRSLEAIENCEFCKLPGGIYTTSYIKQYARAIDYDESTLLAAYQKQMGNAAEQAGQKKPVNRDNGNFGGFKPASGVLGL